MLQNRETSQFKAVLQSYLPERRLVRQRNAPALFFKTMRGHYDALYDEETVYGLFLVAEAINMDVKGMYKQPDSHEHAFQRLALRKGVGDGDGYSFADPALHTSRLELHTRLASATNVRQLVTDLGTIASHLAQPEDECQGFDNITAVSYPEIINPLIRMGMEPTPVSIAGDINVTLTLLQKVYCRLNERPAPPACEPVAVYMPTTEFVEKFSRFAA